MDFCVISKGFCYDNPCLYISLYINIYTLVGDCFQNKFLALNNLPLENELGTVLVCISFIVRRLVPLSRLLELVFLFL
jgi:hypothetical protein